MKTLNNAELMNAVRAASNLEYQSAVDYANDASDYKKIGAQIFANPNLTNSFIDVLVNRICKEIFSTRIATNKLKQFYEGISGIGEYVVEYIAEPVKAEEWKVVMETTDNDKMKALLGTVQPDMKSAVFIPNARFKQKISIPEEEIAMACTKEFGLAGLVNQIVTSMESGREMTHWAMGKLALARQIIAAKKEYLGSSPTNATILETARSLRNKFDFESRDYTTSGVLTHCPKENIFHTMTPELEANIDVNTLSNVFNLEKSELLSHMLYLNGYTLTDDEVKFAKAALGMAEGEDLFTADELTLLGKVKMVMFDEDAFRYFTRKNQTTAFYNPENLCRNVFYHEEMFLGFSPFRNFVVLMDGTAASESATATYANVANVVGAKSAPSFSGSAKVTFKSAAVTAAEGATAAEVTINKKTGVVTVKTAGAPGTATVGDSTVTVTYNDGGENDKTATFKVMV